MEAPRRACRPCNRTRPKVTASGCPRYRAPRAARASGLALPRFFRSCRPARQGGRHWTRRR